MKKHKVPGMPGWIDIGSDASWDDYGGKWARRAKDGSWYVIEFTNMWDACGEDECKADGQDQYVCEVVRVDLNDLDAATIKSALDCVGLYRLAMGICSDSGDCIAPVEDKTRYEAVLVEACVSYGAKQPLESFSRRNYPANLRAACRRAAERLMKDAAALETKLARPVNKIGSTAREYARGEIMPALTRGEETPEKSLMLKCVGMPTLGGGIFGEK